MQMISSKMCCIPVAGSLDNVQRIVSIIGDSQLLIMHRRLHTSARFEIGGFVILIESTCNLFTLPISGLTEAAVPIP
jgi:hypothetical protein